MKKYFFMLHIITAASFPLAAQNVGIGTIDPLFMLDVRNGSINTDSVYRIGTFRVLSIPNSGSVFVGKNSGRITTGLNNTFCGDRTGYDNTTGPHNSFFGQDAGTNNIGGSSNSFFGKEAGFGTTSGSSNSFFGRDAGASNTTGGNNSSFGQGSGPTGSAASNTTAIGYNALVLGNLSNATVIGNGATVDASNKVRIGSTTITSIGGQVIWTAFSDGRYKYQIREDVPGLEFIKKLRTLSYQVDIEGLDKYYATERSRIDKNPFSIQSTFNQAGHINRQTGFIAQEVEQAANELGFSFSGVDKPENKNGLYGLRYGAFVVPLVKAVQELADRTATQQLIVEQQQKIIEQQNQKIELLLKEIAMVKERLK